MSIIYNELEKMAFDLELLYPRKPEHRNRNIAFMKVLNLCRFLIYEPFSQEKLDKFIKELQEGKPTDVLSARDIQQATKIRQTLSKGVEGMVDFEEENTKGID